MENRLSNSFFRTAAALALLLSAGACKDDVALPMQSITLDTHAILAPSFGTTLSFEVRANCDWQISVTGDDTSWAQLSRSEATGTATVAVTIGENATSASRSLTLRVAARRNAAVAEELNFVQASATSDGYLSVSDLRALAADGDYTVTQEVKLRGIVVSSVQDNNYFDNCLALQSDLKPRCGITLRTDETLYRNPGEELEIDLKGAVVGVNAETGVMELKPVSDDRVVRSETTQVTPEALPVTYAQLASGDYESMYVSLDVQVVVSDLSKVLSDNVTVQTADDERFTLYARQNSTFGIDAVPAVRHCGRVRREQRRDALHGGGFRGDERAPLRRRHHASLRVVGHDPHGGQRRRQVHLLFRFERHGVDRRRFGDGDGRHGRQHHGQAEFLGQ